MNNNAVTFQTRARTIDHLGRGQIADLPTAVTELWKNAYDAYARNVSLNIFEGESEIAAVFDDGCGMSKNDFIERWLVIGTESKISGSIETEEERFGLPPRPRQGEKGIGRLSAAFIAPVTLAISKKVGEPYAIAAVDWRLFENPFLALQDIQIPVEEFDKPDQVRDVLPKLFKTLQQNVTPPDDSPNASYIKAAWERHASFQEDDGLNKSGLTKFAYEDYSSAIIKCLDEWIVFAGLEDHGTALVMLGIQDELASWVRKQTPDEATDLARERLTETLSAFTDSLCEDRIQFDYEVLAHRDSSTKSIIRTNDVFGYDDFLELEHSVRGRFDENGVFTGQVIAFGKNLGIKTFAPKRQPSKHSLGRIGGLDFCIGTFEQEERSTTHSSEHYHWLKDQADNFGGMKIYRDGIRVMPYGTQGADFFRIEERRTKHAGREFWSYRRSFGRVAISGQGNPNLKDKAGREGLVVNRARNDLQLLVEGLLMEFARRYFGTASVDRKPITDEIKKRYAKAQKAREKARKKRRTDVRIFLKENEQGLSAAINKLDTLEKEVSDSGHPDELAVTSSSLKELLDTKNELRPPPVPPKAESLENQYRKYRDDYYELSAGLDRISKLQADKEAEIGSASPVEAMQAAFHSRMSKLNGKVDKHVKLLSEQVDTLKDNWREVAESDRKRFYADYSFYMNEDPVKLGLSKVINDMDSGYRELSEEFSMRYEAYLRALGKLDDGIDLDGALTVADDDLVALEDHVQKLNSVAQLGITVEIIGHELETMDSEARRNLKRLPQAVRETKAYKMAFESLSSLTDRLRFLAPMKISGYRAREEIKGSTIADYISNFFDSKFTADRIHFEATDNFRNIAVRDLPSRIYPTFINLINNAAHWVTFSDERKIVLDVVNGKVIVADSGPGVDRDDIEKLFTLFFTRRHKGRGVGLYLAKANLSVANHRIRYAESEDPQILPGANFIIEFRGV